MGIEDTACHERTGVYAGEGSHKRGKARWVEGRETERKTKKSGYRVIRPPARKRALWERHWKIL